MPTRLLPELTAALVQYPDTGLRVEFSSLQIGELVQVHFVVAWASHGDPDRVDTWFAVDQTASEILAQWRVDKSTS